MWQLDLACLRYRPLTAKPISRTGLQGRGFAAGEVVCRGDGGGDEAEAAGGLAGDGGGGGGPAGRRRDGSAAQILSTVKISPSYPRRSAFPLLGKATQNQ